MHDWPATAAVIGAGAMGTGFAQLLARAGIATRVADATAERAEEARARAVELARRFADAGLMTSDDAGAIERHLSAAASIGDAVDGAAFAIEAVTEDPGVKAAVYEQVEARAPADAVIASNTSAIPIRELSASFRRPERFLGLHWFFPAQWVPGVEVIPGPHTAPEVVERSHELIRRLGKRPVTVGDSAGFVANRIQFAMFKEAAAVVADGVATAEQVDEIVRSSFGFRLPFFGPFTIADMAGLDVYAGAYAALERDLGERFAVPGALRELVEDGRLGVKAGGGFTGLTGAAAQRVADRRDASYAALDELRERLESEHGA